MLDLGALYDDHLATLGRGYRELLATHQLDAIVLAAGQAAPRSRFDDQAWPTVITPAFAHWLPLPEPDAFVIVDGGARPRLVRVDTGDYWESAPRAESEVFWDRFTVITVRDLAAALAALQLESRSFGMVHIIGQIARASYATIFATVKSYADA